MVPNFQSPEMLEMLQHRLDSLAGRSSGYIETLPENVQNRIAALKNLQAKHSDLDAQFEVEVLALEKKFLSLFRPLYEKRSEIVAGTYEPSAEEYHRDAGETAKIFPEADESVVGIPEFWLTALKNSPEFQDTITEKDEAALKHLTDISYSYLESNLGFSLTFTFSDNEFFTNSILTKSYYLNKSEPGAQVMFERAEGTEIEWKEGMNLSVTVEVKKQRNKNTNKTRTVKRTVPVQTFFTFFTPVKCPNEDDEDEFDEEMMEEMEQKVEMDYEAGEFLKEKLIPNSIGWFTGEALEMEEGFGGYGNEGSEYESSGEDEEESSGDDAGQVAGAEAAAANPECKQQ